MWLDQRHESNLEARQALIKELGQKHSIPGFDHDLTEEEIRELEDKLEEAIVQHTSKIEKIKVRQNQRERGWRGLADCEKLESWV